MSDRTNWLGQIIPPLTDFQPDHEIKVDPRWPPYVVTIDDYMDSVDHGMFIDYDGYGHPAIERDGKFYEDRRHDINPSDGRDYIPPAATPSTGSTSEWGPPGSAGGLRALPAPRRPLRYVDHPMINLTDANFQREIAKQELPLLVIFRAGFCGPSAALDPIIDQIVEDYSDRVATAIVDVETCPKMTREMQVKGTPTAIILNLGVPLASRIGTMTYDEFADWIEEVACK